MRPGIDKFWMGLLLGMLLMIVFVGGAATEKVWGLPVLDRLGGIQSGGELITQKIFTEESVVTSVAERVSPGVVTVTYKRQVPVLQQYILDPLGRLRRSSPSGTVERDPIDIGSGFVVDSAGLIVTNKHVVSAGVASDYQIILRDESVHSVEKIWRDPVNDLAILKIEPGSYSAVELGDSDKLKVGNSVIAIGTALGEFRHTVTTGVVSGLGRGITAGDGFFHAEKLDGVIQTDAAINPGNSGGPLLNSAGQVIGVNVAVSTSANNIGFALPINVVKASLETFNATGQFDRPFFGVRYQMVNGGAQVVEVMPNSAADVAGIRAGDVIVSFDGQNVMETTDGLAGLLLKKKIGDRVEVEIYRDQKTEKIVVELKGE